MSKILLALAFLVLLVGPRAQSPAGDWQGRIEAPGLTLAIEIHLAERDGTWSGTIDIPAQGAKALPLTAFAVTPPKVVFAIADVPGEPTFLGELGADGSEITGTFTQGGARSPFALRRGDGGAAVRAQLDGLQAWLDDARAKFLVPGCAVAVVRGGALVATFTSGLRDVERDLPVTADTLFAIGSSTKAFTTALLATLVADGKLAWDEPVRRWLPEFTLADLALSERITPRDLVTHRSGMPRHDLAWYGATFERADMVARMRHLPLSEDLRVGFQYNNLMYLAAGHLAERLAAASWEELVRARLLAPLGMARANFAVAAMQQDGDHAVPYRKADGKVGRIPFRDISAMGPAGSINASVHEMARWLLLHLGRGEVDGRRVVDAAALADLYAVRTPMAGSGRDAEIIPVGYASGWFVDVYRGHRRVHHGGNIDGFSAMVTLLPEADVGFCVLTNLDGTPLGEMVVRQLSDRVLGLPVKDWQADVLARARQAEQMAQKGAEAASSERRPGTQPSHPLDEYAGDYRHPGYGDCRIELRDGRLHVDLHGLRAALEHWHFDVFAWQRGGNAPELDGAKVQFTSDLDGEIDGLRIALEPSVAPAVFGRQADARLSDPEFLRTLAGDYELGAQVVTCTLVDRKLVMTLPGQRHELQPRRGLVFQLAGLSGYSVRFVTDPAGRVTGLRVRQPEGVFAAVRKQVAGN